MRIIIPVSVTLRIERTRSAWSLRLRIHFVVYF